MLLQRSRYKSTVALSSHVLFLYLYIFHSEEPATLSGGRPTLRRLQQGDVWATKQVCSDKSSLQMRLQPLANSWTASLSILNPTLLFSWVYPWYSHVYFMCGYCFSYSLYPLPHQNLHNLVCLAQWHLEEWLAPHSYSNIITMYNHKICRFDMTFSKDREAL